MSTKVRRKPKQRRAQVTVDAILEATAQLLLQDGPARLSTNRIAKRAGVSVGTLYQYFPDKEAVVQALGERVLDRQFRAFERDLMRLVDQDQAFEEQTRALVEGLLDLKRMEPELARILLTTGAVGGSDWNQQWLQRQRAVVRSALHLQREHVREGDLDMMAYVLTGAFEFLIQDALVHQPHLIRDGSLARELGELAVRYLRIQGHPDCEAPATASSAEGGGGALP